MNDPFNLLHQWLQAENKLGAADPQLAVLSTCTIDAIPHARVVAIREITSDGLLFFTQRGTRKVEEIKNNPNAVLTFWFELQQKEIIFEGKIETLAEKENISYWQTYQREAKLRFYSYAATSSQPISDKYVLENKKKEVENLYHDQDIPYNPLYCGFRLKPDSALFYVYRTDELSDVIKYHYVNQQWSKKIMSP